MLEVEFAEVSDVGKVRPHNEDYIGHVCPATPAKVRSHGWLFALADGVGGQDKGEVASRLAIETTLSEFSKAAPGEALASLLPRAIQAANMRVYEAAHGAIATTIVTCALRYDRAVVAHVGDSRCYLIRRNQVRVLTRDHTVVGEQVRLGVLSEAEAKESATKNVLSRSLGIGMFVSADVEEHTLAAGDVLLLCSDGLHGPLNSPDIAKVVNHVPDLDEAARQLVAIANERDGGDNVSIQLIRVREVERVGMYRGRPYRIS